MPMRIVKNLQTLWKPTLIDMIGTCNWVGLVTHKNEVFAAAFATALQANNKACFCSRKPGHFKRNYSLQTDQTVSQPGVCALHWIPILLMFQMILNQLTTRNPSQLMPWNSSNIWVTLARTLNQTTFCASVQLAAQPFHTCLVGIPLSDSSIVTVSLTRGLKLQM